MKRAIILEEQAAKLARDNPRRAYLLALAKAARIEAMQNLPQLHMSYRKLAQGLCAHARTLPAGPRRERQMANAALALMYAEMREAARGSSAQALGRLQQSGALFE